MVAGLNGGDPRRGPTEGTHGGAMGNRGTGAQWFVIKKILTSLSA